MKKTIGLYDSGVGGLSVLKEMLSRFPNEKFIYFADTANLPYGNKTKMEIIQYSNVISNWLEKEMGVDVIIAACNTSSALALDEISADINVPIIGAIKPILNYINSDVKIKKLGVIGTQASIDSGIHEKMIKASGFAGDVLPLACPEFVDIIENGIMDSDLAKQIVKDRLMPLNNKIDSLIFGCTHYLFIRDIVEDIFGPDIVYIDPAQYIAAEVAKFINTEPSEEQLTNISFYTSSDPELFSAKLINLIGIKAKPTFVAL